MKVLVTGGGGFVGLAVVRRLVARGDEVVSVSRSRHAALDTLGAAQIAADVSDARAMRDAVRGCDTVIHTAAKAGVWGPREEYERANVAGTRAVVEACAAERVTKLVFTSSPSVCFDGTDHVNASNDLPRARSFLCDYPRTKALAEEIALAANGRDGLATVALRPHLVFGPGDPHLVPRLLARARARKLVRVGDGRNEVSLTHVENAAAAHVAALDALELGAPCAGRAYFVAQRDPVRLWSWIDELLAGLDVPRVRRSLSARNAYALGAACEATWRLLRRSDEPPLTRFVALQLSTTHTYDLTPLERDVGYREEISMHDATRALVASEQRSPASARF